VPRLFYQYGQLTRNDVHRKKGKEFPATLSRFRFLCLNIFLKIGRRKIKPRQGSRPPSSAGTREKGGDIPIAPPKKTGDQKISRNLQSGNQCQVILQLVTSDPPNSQKSPPLLKEFREEKIKMIQNDHRDRAMMTSLSFNNFRVTRYRNRTRSTTAGTTHIHLNIRWEMVLFLYMCAFIVSMHQDKSKCCRRINSCVAFFPIKSGLHFSVFRSGFPLFLEL
jgi:hypothetical protein